ncbi:MAG: hypothetical protein M3N25_09780, partial [Actinomycetota bacterium]|nr:hypothetical protein [Actinomycetota bacterium]
MRRRTTALLAAASVLTLVAPMARQLVFPAEVASGPGIGARAGFSPGATIFNESDADLARSLDAMAATGGEWVRLDVPWHVVEPNAPVLDLLGVITSRSFDWSRVDRLVDAAHARGLKVVALPHLTPSWA